MKKLTQDVKAVTKGLRALTKKTEAIAKKVDKLEKARAAKKPRAKTKAKAKTAKRAPAKKITARKKAAKLTATDQVIKILKRSKKGLDAPTLIKKTGFGERSVRNILYKASKARKIKRTGRGVYVAA
jgi:hypothetical protein